MVNAQRGLFILSALAMLPLAPAASASDLIGRAAIIDGDTIEIHGQRIRLFGIDAPEHDQLCEAAGTQYRCGQQAALALSDKIGSRTVDCAPRDVDQYGRIVAVCLAGGEDLNGWMVRNNWALAYRHYSAAYVLDEDAAHWQAMASGEGRSMRHGIGGKGSGRALCLYRVRRLRPPRPRVASAPSRATSVARASDLPRARWRVLRTHADRSLEGRAMVLLRGRGAGGRMAEVEVLNVQSLFQDPSLGRDVQAVRGEARTLARRRCQ